MNIPIFGTRGTGSPNTRQTDSAKIANSGESRERPTFDFSKLPEIDPQEVREWLTKFDPVERNFPLALALQMRDEIERLIVSAPTANALFLSECRGALRALHGFAKLYAGYNRIQEGR